MSPDECYDHAYQSENEDSQEEQLNLQPEIKPLADLDLTPEVPAHDTAKLLAPMPKAIAGNPSHCHTWSTIVAICLNIARFHCSLCCNEGHPKRCDR